MKKVMAGFVFLAIAALAGNALAGGKRFYIGRETWKQEIKAGDRSVYSYNGARVTSMTPWPKEGDRVKGEDGRIYRWIPDESSSPVRNSVGDLQPAEKSRRVAAEKPRSSGKIASGQKPARSLTVPYFLEKGDTVSGAVSHYTEKTSVKKVLEDNWLTEEEAKKLQVGFGVALPAKNLKPEYQNPLKRIDELREEIGEYKSRIAALEKENAELRQALEKKVDVLEEDLKNLSRAAP
ncbi:MAG: hypothetical protein QG620_521 [Patescibacteria group bacterium]|nr:hypothetical protein [Patescibacteria group bacterium]